MSSKYTGRGTRQATPRPTAGRPANEAAFNRAIAVLERLITRAARKPHTYATANRIFHRLDSLAAGYEMNVLCAAPDYPPDEYDVDEA